LIVFIACVSLYLIAIAFAMLLVRGCFQRNGILKAEDAAGFEILDSAPKPGSFAPKGETGGKVGEDLVSLDRMLTMAGCVSVIKEEAR